MEYTEEQKERWVKEKERAKQKAEQIITDITETYETDPRLLVELLEFSSRFYQYSYRNKVLIQNQNPGATYVQSFAAWKKAGYPVKANEKGIRIFVYTPLTYLDISETKSVLLSKATKEQKQAYKAGKIKSHVVPNYDLGSVFDISQTICPPEKYPEYYYMGYENIEAHELMKGLEAYAEKHLNTRVVDNDLHSIALRGQAFVQPTMKDGSYLIELNEKLKDSERFSTLTHEIAHQVLHRHLQNKLPELIEVEADCFSIMLSSRLNITIAETRKRHLADNFNSLKAAVAASDPEAGKTLVEKIITDIYKVYASEGPKIDAEIKKINQGKEAEKGTLKVGDAIAPKEVINDLIAPGPIVSPERIEALKHVAENDEAVAFFNYSEDDQIVHTWCNLYEANILIKHLELGKKIGVPGEYDWTEFEIIYKSNNQCQTISGRYDIGYDHCAIEDVLFASPTQDQERLVEYFKLQCTYSHLFCMADDILHDPISCEGYRKYAENIKQYVVDERRVLATKNILTLSKLPIPYFPQFEECYDLAKQSVKELISDGVQPTMETVNLLTRFKEISKQQGKTLGLKDVVKLHQSKTNMQGEMGMCVSALGEFLHKNITFNRGLEIGKS
ncbi:MAG: ImmA/IrrE family metallo-endopeptidase [Enterocloster asparagiformis]|nr:ImmA/IrrE family metallo-endopeptidase [Enterocloster asparagiformis]